MKRTRALTCAVGMLVAGLLAGASGCDSTPEDPGASARKSKPAGSPTAARTGAEQVSAHEERACKGGTYTWFNMQSQYLLNGVTDAQPRMTKPSKMTKPMRRLRTDQASLESEGPRPDAKAVFYALSVRIGLADKGEDPEDLEGWSGLGEPGAYAPLYDDGDWTGGVGSRLVAFSAVEMVDVDFRYTCKGGKHREPTVGHVSTWGRDLSGALNCEDPLPEGASGAAREAALREAVRLSCGR